MHPLLQHLIKLTSNNYENPFPHQDLGVLLKHIMKVEKKSNHQERWDQFGDENTKLNKLEASFLNQKANIKLLETKIVGAFVQPVNVFFSIWASHTSQPCLRPAQKVTALSLICVLFSYFSRLSSNYYGGWWHLKW
jgi:hypothetical protein